MKRTRVISGILAAAGLSIALVGCTTPGAEQVEASAPSSEAAEYVPEVTDEGGAVLEGIVDCAQIAGYFGALADGLELTLESLDTSSAFCDWVAADNDQQVLSVEVWPASSSVPSVEEVTASGGMVLDDARIAQEGGIAYVIAPTDAALAVTVLLPTHSASVTAMNLTLEDEQRQQIALGLLDLLGLSE